MSKIAVQITDANDIPRTLAALRRVEPDVSIAELRARISAGAPVLEYTLFGNDHPLVASKLRAIVQALPDFGATLKLFELSERDSFDVVDGSTDEISVETLNNILRIADEFEERDSSCMSEVSDQDETARAAPPRIPRIRNAGQN